MERLRPRIVKECWRPSAERDPSPAKATFPARFLFDPKGKLAGYDVGEAVAESRLDVSRCIRDMKLSITIPEPGMLVAVQIGIPLP
jgi:hypothetical protein